MQHPLPNLLLGLGLLFTLNPPLSTAFAQSTAFNYQGRFTGGARWLEVGARSNGGGGFPVPSPRPSLRPADFLPTPAAVLSWAVHPTSDL